MIRRMHTTPPSLLQRLRDPAERQAWDTFVELYAPLLLVWSKRWGVPDADAADLVQEALLLLYRKLPTFNYNAAGTFRGWLRALLINKWREMCRRQRPEPAGDRVELAVEPNWTEQEDQEYRQHVLRVTLKAI